MPQRGDIVVERLTGKRAIVIQIGGEEVTCRFGDGRLEERFTFELEPALPFFNQLVAFLASLLGSAPRERPQVPSDRVRPLLVKPSNAS
jgi:hypothetical protein